MIEKAYAAFSLDENIREKSSSGGIFYPLAKEIIKNNGIVFGAMFDKEWNVVHGYTETLEGIENFLGSKYVQSNIGNMFVKAKEFLENGRTVLFSGTPCQIYGLKSYLGKEYKNLFTIDFICHGVPSPKVWHDYLEERSEGRTISRVNFRDKTEGWKASSLNINFSDGNIYRKNNIKEVYLKGFLGDIYLRPSCYECSFKGINRISDITLADFWGAEKAKLPEIFARGGVKGISAVIIHSELGKYLWWQIDSMLQTEEVPIEIIIKYNKYAIESVKKPEKRNNFFNYTNEPIIEKIERYTKTTRSKKIKSFGKRMLIKLKIYKE